MKKEAVSVLKPNFAKNSKKKTKKVSPKKEGRVVKKIVENNVEPRGQQKSKIDKIKHIDISSNLENVKRIQKLPKTKDVVETKVKDDKTKISKKNAAATGKMAASREDREVPRDQPRKKIKIQTTDEPIKTIKKTKKVKAKSNISEEEVPIVISETQPEKLKKIVKKDAVDIKNTGDLKLTKKRISNSILSLLELSAKQLKAKKLLLPTESHPILLQVTPIKVPNTPRRQIRPYLPHSLVGPLDDVALFVPDLERGLRKDYEKTVDHWETILREKGVDCIKEIIPMNKVKTEYSQFEMKRKLAKSFDFFLADGRICGHLSHLLGKTFLKRKCPPTPVKLDPDDLKKNLDVGLHKTCIEIHSYGNSHTMQVGTVSMEEKKLVENIWAACEALAEEYPGGWKNIRSIYIKTNLTLAIPIYISLVSKNKIGVPQVKPKRPRAYETVEGELTTLPGNVTVKMTPEGRINMKRTRDFGDEEKDEKEEELKTGTDDDEDDEDEEDDKSEN